MARHERAPPILPSLHGSSSRAERIAYARFRAGQIYTGGFFNGNRVESAGDCTSLEKWQTRRTESARRATTLRGSRSVFVEYIEEAATAAGKTKWNLRGRVSFRVVV